MNEEIVVEAVNVGEIIKELCRINNMTKSKLANKIGIAQHTISNIIRGKRKPQKLTLKRIARAFGLTVEEMLAYRKET